MINSSFIKIILKRENYVKFSKVCSGLHFPFHVWKITLYKLLLI